jgi:hypothetical protein
VVALLSLLLLGSLLLMAYCVLDVATSRPEDVRGVPKPVWFVILLAPVLGAVLWFALGRPERGAVSASPRMLPEPGRAGGGKAPDDDEVFLRELRRRAAEQRRRAEEQRRRDGLGDDHGGGGGPAGGPTGGPAGGPPGPGPSTP